jgi:hypothetical protein
MKQMKQKNPNKSPIYNCDFCKYITNNKKDFNKHLITPKHKKETNETLFETENPKNKIYNCNKCLVNFNSRTTLWRHQKTCIDNINAQTHINESSKNHEFSKEILINIIKENHDFQKDMQKQMFEFMKTNICHNSSINTINNLNNSNNKTFNLQVFLNETCKDAMNISDFIESIKLQVSDLENVGKSGYIEGISKIIIKNLNALDTEKRPIHCTDQKREVIYIKDQDVWEKEEDNKPKLRRLIKEVAHKNICMFKKFREKYPDCDSYDSKKGDLFNKIVYESMGGKGDDDYDKDTKIINKISKQVTIEKDNYLY